MFVVTQFMCTIMSSESIEILAERPAGKSETI